MQKKKKGSLSEISKFEEWKATYLQPLLLFFREHTLFDHFGLDRYTCQTFKPEPDVPVEVSFGLFIPPSEGRMTLTQKTYLDAAHS